MTYDKCDNYDQEATVKFLKFSGRVFVGAVWGAIVGTAIGAYVGAKS